MKDIHDERPSTEKPFSYEKMRFRYKYAAKFLRPGKVLDIGCGNGYGFRYLRKNDYYGIDYYEPSIQEGRRLFPEANFLCSQLPELPFAAESFDNVLCLEVIEHLEEKDVLTLLDEIHRILKPQGVLFISSPNFDNKETLWQDHIKEYTKKEMKELLQRRFHIYHEGGFLDSYCWKFVQGLGKGTPITTEKKEGLRSKKKWMKFMIRVVAFIITRVGYYRPNKAIHQAYACRK